MSAQAQHMKGVVGELVVLVGGGGSEVGSREYAAGRKEMAGGREAAPEVHKAIAAPAKKAKGKEVAVHETKSKIRRGGEVKPDEVIPMDDKDFKDF